MLIGLVSGKCTLVNSFYHLALIYGNSKRYQIVGPIKVSCLSSRQEVNTLQLLIINSYYLYYVVANFHQW